MMRSLLRQETTLINFTKNTITRRQLRSRKIGIPSELVEMTSLNGSLLRAAEKDFTSSLPTSPTSEKNIWEFVHGILFIAIIYLKYLTLDRLYREQCSR